jgi:putative ABC transport system permease protein
VVASVREVDWRRVEPNFYFLFPRGVLEEAPAFEVMLTRVESAERSAEVQRALVREFPNVAAIDTTLVLQTLDAILGKISFAIRFMALFTVITGVLVLVGAVLTGRYQRIRESVLLRTLGASRAQVLRILLVEYACLGFLAALTGIALAVGASWALAAFVFHVRFVPSFAGLVLALAAGSGLTVAAGLLASRGVLNQPPLEILRAEV